MISRYSQKCSVCFTRITVDAGGPLWAAKKFKRQGWYFSYPVMWYCPECNTKRKQMATGMVASEANERG